LYLFTAALALSLTGYRGPAPGQAVTIGQFTHLQAVDAAVRVLVAAAMVALARVMTRGQLKGWGLAPAQLASGVTLGLLATVLIAPWIFLAMEGTDSVVRHLGRKPPIHEVLEILQHHPPTATMVVLVFSAAVVAPVAEELFFRGILQTALLQKNPFSFGFGAGLPGLIPLPDETPEHSLQHPGISAPSPARRWVAILIAAILFALMHGEAAFVPVLMVLAVALGYLYERTGNLWACITLHATFNCTSLILTLGFPNAGG
jgi:membrane protease YdiL (CAAX protease family)